MKGKQIGIIDFTKTAMKWNLKLPNIFLHNKLININEIRQEEQKISHITGEKPKIYADSTDKLNLDVSPAVKPPVAHQIGKWNL